MTVVSDTSAITSLLQIGKEGILLDLFSRVFIPTAVKRELLRYHNKLPSFLEIKEVERDDFLRELLIDIDEGEAEAIALARNCSTDFLLIDDFYARTIAIQKGFNVIGLVGVLTRAKQLNVIHSLRSVLDDLEVRAGFRISKPLRERALQSVGEV